MEEQGKYLIHVDRFFPSSKLCSVCGHKNKNLELKDRQWECPMCKTFHDRDINAAINITTEGKILIKEMGIEIEATGGPGSLGEFKKEISILYGELR